VTDTRNPFGVPEAGDFHCSRCGTLLDGGTDEPVAARELRAERDALRIEANRLRTLGDAMARAIEERWSGDGSCDCPCCTAARAWRGAAHDVR
jgi:hypothetical protein